MENRVTFDYSKAMQFIGENEITSIKAIAETAKNILVEKSGAGVRLPRLDRPSGEL